MSYFITGTDTAVGKTRVAALLIRALRSAGVDAAGFKPLCCGDRQDAEDLHAAADGRIALNDVNPVWLRPPVAPYAASMIEGREVDVALVRETFARVRTACASLVVEGAGGWLVPITRDYSMADLAAEFALPVIVVAANRLGVLNHTLLTVRAIRAAGLPCAGVILNHLAAPAIDNPAAVTNPAILEDLLRAESVPLLGEIDFAATTLLPSILKKLTPIPRA